MIGFFRGKHGKNRPAHIVFGILHPFFFDDKHGVYSSFIDTLLTSILFIVLILRRGNVKGQYIYIAISKMLGTLSAVLAYNFFAAPPISPRLAIHIFHTVFNIPLAPSGVPRRSGEA